MASVHRGIAQVFKAVDTLVFAMYPFVLACFVVSVACTSLAANALGVSLQQYEIRRAGYHPRDLRGLRIAVETSPVDYQARRQYADLLYEGGKYRQAAIHYDVYLRHRQGSPETVHRYLIALASYKGDTPRGERAAEHYLNYYPTDADLHMRLGYFRFWLGKDNDAEQAFEQAIRLSPQYALAHQWYALHLLTTGRADEAIIEAELGVDLDPVYPEAHRKLSFALQAAGRTEDSIERSRELIQLAPSWLLGWDNLAIVLLEGGEYDEALEAGLNLSRLMGEDLQVAREAYQSVIRYWQTGDPQTVSEPPEWEAWKLAWLYANVGQTDRSIELLEVQLGQGSVGDLALSHVLNYSDLLGDDPRYQALLEEAGITW